MEISTLMTKICMLKPTLEMCVLRYPLNAEDADQLVQDTLIKALLEADSYSEVITLKYWLLSLMKEKYDESYQAVQMRVVYNGFNNVDNQENFTKEELRKMLLGKLDEFDADLLGHEEQYSIPSINIKEA